MTVIKFLKTFRKFIFLISVKKNSKLAKNVIFRGKNGGKMAKSKNFGRKNFFGRNMKMISKTTLTKPNLTKTPFSTFLLGYARKKNKALTRIKLSYYYNETKNKYIVMKQILEWLAPYPLNSSLPQSSQ